MNDSVHWTAGYERHTASVGGEPLSWLELAGSGGGGWAAAEAGWVDPAAGASGETGGWRGANDQAGPSGASNQFEPLGAPDQPEHSGEPGQDGQPGLSGQSGSPGQGDQPSQAGPPGALEPSGSPGQGGLRSLSVPSGSPGPPEHSGQPSLSGQPDPFDLSGHGGPPSLSGQSGGSGQPAPTAQPAPTGQPARANPPHRPHPSNRPDPPVVLVHGVQGSALEHCELGRRLGGPVHLLDLRAHGRTPAAPGNPSAGSLADQVGLVTTFVREVVGRPVVLAGNSFGAMVCAHVARTAPDAVLGLVLIGPAVRPSRIPVDPVRVLQWLVQKARVARDRYDADVRSGRRREDPDALTAEATSFVDSIPDAYLTALRAEPEPAWSVGNPAGRAALWRTRNDALVQLSRPRRWIDLLRTLTPPGLWLHGTEDPIMPRATAETVRALLPGWQVDTIPATGHLPHLERAGWTAERITSWLGSLPRR